MNVREAERRTPDEVHRGVLARRESLNKALLPNLPGLNERTSLAAPETVARWLSGDVEEATSPLEASARHGFATFLYLAEEIFSTGLTLKLDY